jgi:hypothetical protein
MVEKPGILIIPLRQWTSTIKIIKEKGKNS